MRLTIGIFMLVALGGTSWAQNFDSDSVYYSPIPKTSPKKKQAEGLNSVRLISYFFNIQSGVLIGCKNCNFKNEVTSTVATTHGITIGNKLRVGAGIGFDTYANWQTRPVFGSVSWDLFGSRNKNAFFLQFNYGWSNPTANRSTFNGYQKIDGGRMVSTLAGFRIRYHDLKIAIGIGSKYQLIKASYQYPSYYYDFRGMPIIGGTPNSTTLRQGLNRVAITMSVGWR